MIDRDFDMTQIMHVKMQSVSDSLHKLADRFYQANENIDTAWLNATSIELQRIAWNSLFVSSTIETLVKFLSSDKLTTDKNDQTLIFRQVDGLHVAAKYLMQSIQSIKARQASLTDNQQTTKEALEDLAVKILEAAHECQNS
jgi:hypothetical protein